MILEFFLNQPFAFCLLFCYREILYFLYGNRVITLLWHYRFFVFVQNKNQFRTVWQLLCVIKQVFLSAEFTSMVFKLCSTELIFLIDEKNFPTHFIYATQLLQSFIIKLYNYKQLKLKWIVQAQISQLINNWKE